MDVAGSPKVTCPSCGKRYLWKPQLRGRKVACACGEKFAVEQPDGAPRAPSTGGYDVAPDPAAPPVRATTATTVRTAPVLQYSGPNQEIEPHRRLLPANWNLAELSVIAAIIALGVGCRILLPLMQEAIGTPRLVLAMTLVLLGLVLNVLVMLVGVRIAAQFADLTLPDPAVAVVKLALIFVISVAAGGFCASLDRFNTNGIILGVHVLFILYWIGFGLLFRTNVLETMWSVSIIALLQAIVNFGIWKL